MKKVSVNLYSIDELSTEAKETALEHHRDINTYYGWWESDYEHFITICKTAGICINPKDIYFTGFYSQGDGSCFGSNIEILDFIKGIAEQAWKKYAPAFDPNLEVCPIDRRVIDLIEKGTIEVDMWTETKHRYYFVHYHSRNNIHGRDERPYQRIEEELIKFHKWAKGTLERLNDCFYKSLEETHNYLLSDKAVN